VPPRPSSASRIAVRGSTPPPRPSAGAFRAPLPSTPPIAKVGRVKGTAIRAALAWFQSTCGDDSLTRVYEQSSPDLRAMLRMEDPAFGVIASGWYDTACIGELLGLLERVADPADPDAWMNTLTTAIAKDNVNGIYRSLFKLISVPKMLEAHAHRVWSTYIDEGTLIARVPSPGQLGVEIRQWAHHDSNVCRTVGFMIQNVLRAVGYTGLVIERTQCVDQGDGLCAFEGMYLP
jgi:hypothetical protein